MINEWLYYNLKTLFDNLQAVLVAMSNYVSSSVLEFATATAVPDNAVTTILTYTVAVDALLLDTLLITGQVDAEYVFTVNTVTKLKFRTSEQERSLKVAFPAAQKFAVGDILALKVIHYNTSGVFDFDATLIGHKG